jgi:hypothetical protein
MNWVSKITTFGRVITFGCAVMTFWFVGCNKKCQAPPSNPFTTFTGTDWRLIDTTKPGMANQVDKFNTVILSFTTNFEGGLKTLVNNNESESAVCSLKYNVQSSGGSGRLTIQYRDPSTGQNAQGQPGSSGTSGNGQTTAGTCPEPPNPIDYTYNLSNSLTLTEVNTGYTYNYVPFQGIVNPDDNCTF